MADLDEHGRPEPPVAGDEVETLLGFLDYQRATFAWKCSGLDAAGLNVAVAASTMTLGGMMKHLALVEDSWFSRYLHARDRHPLWRDVDWDADPDWEWHSAADDSPDELRSMWEDAVANSRSCVADAFEKGDLGLLAKRKWPDRRAP
ncbi:MAG: DinB family protein, partial [Actinomycetota bacterium]|nr:DinB family protein [Actinomycetota bacterium]